MNSVMSDNPAIVTVDGIIHRVDTVSRQLGLLVQGASMELAVAPDCVIRLSGETVKLRLLQPGDRATVAYAIVGRTAFAHSVEVNWLHR